MKTMIKISNALMVVVLFSLLTGCACYYAPNAQNVPQFSEKGQVNISGSYQFGQFTHGFNAQGAVAASEHFGIMGNYNYFNDSYMSTNNMGEIGFGYFDNFGKKGAGVFETYTGFGAGRVKIEDGGLQMVNTTSFFIQPDIGFKRDKFSMAFSTRFRFMHFNVTRDDLPTDYYEYDMIDQCNTGFIEPALTMTFGGKMVRFQWQMMLSYAVGDIVYYDMINSNLGLVFCIPPKKGNNTPR